MRNSSSPPKFFRTVDYNENTGCITDYCTSRGFPLGGIGTGGFNFLSDGGFAHFRTNHNWFRFVKGTKFPKGTFFATRIKTPDSIVTRILRRTFPGGTEFRNIAPVAHTKFTGKIPCFQLSFEDIGLPVQVSVSGFSALIPRNPKDSTLPAAFFTVTIQNPLDVSVDISVLMAFENILGLGGSGGSHLLLPFDGPVAYRRTRGNYAESFRCEGGQGVCFKTKQQAQPTDPRRRVLGEYLLLTPRLTSSDSNVQISAHTAWSSKDPRPPIFDYFHTHGEIGNAPASTKPNAGVVCVKTTLPPKKSQAVDFILIWWTPYYVLEKRQRVRKYSGHHAGTDYGQYYLNFFQTSTALAEYCLRERDRLARESRELETILKDSTLPPWLQTYVLNSADSMLVNTCVPRDGRFYVIEGCPWDWMFGGLTGTLDQRLASHPFSSIFFPEFDQAELELFRDLGKNGQIPHGDGHCDIALGTNDVPYGMPIRIVTGTKHWTDLPQSLILQLGKLFMIMGDWSLLRKSWPYFVQMVAYLDSTCKEHIPDGATTYDYMYYRPHFVYSAILQLATLRMMTYLGTQLYDNPDTPPEEKITVRSLLPTLEARYKDCHTALQRILWDVHGYFKTCGNRDTIFTSALAGDWIARYCGLGGVIDHDQARSHSEWQSRVLVESHDHLVKRGKKLRPLVYREADPTGHEIPVKINLSTTYQVNNCWQSLAYQAFEAIYLGRVDAGLATIKRIWDKGYYEGYPWNMDHWGFPTHIYMTHPTMWAVFNALTGAALDVSAQEITLSPRLFLGQENFRVPVFFPNIWLRVAYDPSSGFVELKILKSFDASFLIRTIKCCDLQGQQKKILLDPPLHNIVGERVSFKFPFEKMAAA